MALVLVALLSTGGVVYYVTREPTHDELALQREPEERLRQQTTEAERERLEREAALRREREERLRQEATGATEAERLRLAREAAATRDAGEQARQGAVAAAAEAERERMEREAAAKREAEERARQEAVAAAAAEAERQRLEREAAAKREAEEQAHQEAVAAAAEAERERMERDAAAKREAEERARQEAVAAASAEAERQRLKRETAAKREAEEAHQEAVAAAAEAERQKQARVTPDPSPTIHQPSPVLQEQACKRDEERLARLRASQARDEVIRFERELGCERLRPQLLRLRESVFAEGERSERDLGSRPQAEQQRPKADAQPQRPEREGAVKVAPPSIPQDQVCKRDAETLARLRASQARDEVIRFERELGCERLRPQVVRLRESIGAN